MKTRSLALRSLLGAALLAPALAVPSQAQQAAPAAPARPFDGIVVQGVGEVRARPNIARLTLGVQTQDKDAQRAAQANATRTTALIAALRGAGVAEADIQTAGFSISPQYDYRPRPVDGAPEPAQPQQPILTGYQVNNEVRVVVRQLANASRVLDAAIRAGANTAGGVAFDLDDRSASRDEALRRAVADATRKSSVLARAAGIQRINLASIVEGSADSPRPFADFARAEVATTQASTPVAPGEIVVSATVTAYYSTTR